jgi:hypothetical protein
METNRRPWYAEWRVWFCLAIFAACGLAQLVVGLPLRVFEAIWNVLF